MHRSSTGDVNIRFDTQREVAAMGIRFIPWTVLCFVVFLSTLRACCRPTAWFSPLDCYRKVTPTG